MAWWGGYSLKEMTLMEGAGRWRNMWFWWWLKTASTRTKLGRLGGSAEEQGYARGIGRRLLVVMTRGSQKEGHWPAAALSPVVETRKPGCEGASMEQGGWDSSGEDPVRPTEDDNGLGTVVGE